MRAGRTSEDTCNRSGKPVAVQKLHVAHNHIIVKADCMLIGFFCIVDMKKNWVLQRHEHARMWNEGNIICCRVSFNRDFVECLKENISKEMRRWNQLRLIWEIDMSQYEVIHELLDAFFTANFKDEVKVAV